MEIKNCEIHAHKMQKPVSNVTELINTRGIEDREKSLSIGAARMDIAVSYVGSVKCWTSKP